MNEELDNTMGADALAPQMPSVEKAQGAAAGTDITALDPTGAAQANTPQTATPRTNAPSDANEAMRTSMTGAYGAVPQGAYGRLTSSISAALDGARRGLRTSGIDARSTALMAMAGEAQRNAAATPQTPQTQTPNATATAPAQRPNAEPGGIMQGATAPAVGTTAQNAPKTPPAASAPNGNNGASTAKPNAPAPVGGAYAQSVGVTMAKRGGREVPSYTYNGVSVDLPNGIDLNDDAAVQGAVASANRDIDIMQSIYGSEEY